MKCKKCGYSAKDISAMARHYRKNHPKAMSRKPAKNTVRKGYCHACGKKL